MSERILEKSLLLFNQKDSLTKKGKKKCDSNTSKAPVQDDYKRQNSGAVEKKRPISTKNVKKKRDQTFENLSVN